MLSENATLNYVSAVLRFLPRRALVISSSSAKVSIMIP